MVKLDLLNSRLELPKGKLVYDSIEDVNFSSSSLSKSCTVHLSTHKTKSRKSKQSAFKAPDRLEIPKINCSGDIIDISLSKGSAVNYGPKPTLQQLQQQAGSASSVFSGSTTFSHKKFAGQETMAICDFKNLVKQAISNDDGKETANISSEKALKQDVFYDTPVLNFIKDKIHEDYSHTIEHQIKKKILPAPNIALSRPMVLTVSASAPQLTTPGPGFYHPKDISVPHEPQVLLNPPKVIKDESKGEIVPLKERIRRDRRQQSLENLLAQYQKKAQTTEERAMRTSQSRKLNPPKLMLRSAFAEDDNPVSFGTSSPRFAGPVYHTESYIKTSGMILGPDFDKKMEDKYRLGPKFGTGPARNPDIKREAVLDPPDVMRLLSMTAEVKRSPIKYTAAFRPPSPKISLKQRLLRGRSPPRHHSPSPEIGLDTSFGESHTLSGTVDQFGNVIKGGEISEADEENENAILGDGSHLGPGAFYPNCAPPSIEIHNPNKLSIPFMQPKSTRSRLAYRVEEEEKARLAKEEEERQLLDVQFREKRMERERLRSQSLLPLVRKRK